MKTIVTKSGAFLTGTEIADAVSAYGLALARARDLDVVDIPFLAAGGALNRVQLRIGWQIETVVTSDQQPADELIEIDTILDLLDRARAVSLPPTPDSSLPRPKLWVDTNWDEVI
jgi:hypothetical protein